MLQTPTSDQAPARRVALDAPLVLKLDGLRTQFVLDDGVVEAVEGVDLEMRRGETLAVVGESGCGKSVMARSILQLVDRPGRIVGGQVWVPRPPAEAVASRRRPGLLRRGRPEPVQQEDGPEGMVNLIGAEPEMIRAVRGKRIAMVFQEPMTSLSAVHTVGNQIIEAIQLHEPMSKEAARERAVDLLRRVGIAGPEKRIDTYPFQLSGGMRQRVMIAMALSCGPELLIADEPTTALDVTTQAQILELLAELREDLGMAIMLITHDLGVAARLADSVAVMYLGRVVERGELAEIFRSPRHPYTQALLRSVPKLGRRRGERLAPVRGMVPHPYARPSGCTFRDRCDHFIPGSCDTALPPLIRDEQGHEVRCVLYKEDDR
ncbi:ATP-binding cassette domain-containing protein [Auraticoccus sp. F435]|uniref:ATP-binding cassette domain-containing protein n=1 Tax=Auraticoccus cholistanensis TaxID=2656650 RepID=A0A6A9US19_9ACTN|nr:ABC transporter ATP-binding protein [Auraticoccus cholistanensis]MVA75583.1 ATP-binding cassette domain-containing protein [Auraticoccus cholistanensis]